MMERRFASCVVEAAHATVKSACILGMPDSALEELCRIHGVRFVREAFPDRAYNDAVRLVPRSVPGAVIAEPSEVARRAVEIAGLGRICAVSGETLRLPRVRTLCLHGDSPSAVQAA